MECHVTDESLEICCPSTRIRSKVSKTVAIAPPGVTRAQLEHVGKAMILLTTGLAYKTVKSYVEALAAIFYFLRVSGNGWPKFDEWPTVIFNLYCYQLLEAANNRKADSSRAVWLRMSIVLKGLMSRNAIPTCPVPNGNLPRNSRLDLAENLTLGEAYEPIPPATIESVQVLPKQYLVDLSYIQESDEFFNSIEAELQKVSDATFDVCMSYWEEMKSSHYDGRALIEKINQEELLIAINDPANKNMPRQGALHPADPDTPNGIAYFLAAVDYYFFERCELQSLSFKTLSSIPFFQRICESDRRRKQLVSRLKQELHAPNFHASDLIARGIGQLSTRDCAVATAILVHQQPRFNPGSLETAEAYDKHGKLHVSLTDAGGEHVFFTVAKDRAKSRKGGILTAVGSKVLIDIHLITARLRARLVKEQPDVANLLYLVTSTRGMGHVGRIGDYFNSKKKSIFDLYRADLERKSITRSTFTLSKVRNTQGILVWLKTEAIVAMASAMGNSVKTVLNNYIPDWLYHRMLTKTARRFQQTFIILATAGSRWQLPASDFTTFKQLENFVVKVLSSGQRGNKLSDLFHKTYAEKFGVVTDYESKGHVFYLSISPVSLAALEVYVNCISKAPFILRQDSSTGSVVTKHLVKLYQLIYSAVHAGDEDEVELMVRDLIAGGSQAQLLNNWRKSRPIVADFMKLVEKIH